MRKLPPLYGRVLSVFVVWTLALSAVMAVAMQPGARAAQCSQSNVVIGGDWTVTDDEVCEGTLYTMTGDLTVNVGASLTLKDGGIRFAQTPATPFSVTVLGTLILDNGTITVTGDTIDPYLLFRFTVSGGTLRMLSDSILAFPGWLTTTGGTVWMDHSSIMALDAGDVSRWTANVDENDDAPAISFLNTNVRIFDSGIHDLFEKSVVDARRQVNLTGSTHFIAINSYIGIDLANASSSAATHNTLNVDAPAQAFLLWPTIDESQTPSHTYDYSNAVNVTGATGAYIYRRADVTVTDSKGAPVASATLAMTYTGTTTAARYPDNGVGATIPHNDILGYLGRTAGTWRDTDAAGQASIPLVSDMIDSTGVYFQGNYNISATYSTYSATRQVGLAHWPAAEDADNHVSVMLTLGFTQLLPDLKASSMSYSPTSPSPKIGDTVTIDINVSNIGQGPAGSFWVRVYDNIILPSSMMHEQQIGTLAAGASFNLTTFTWVFNSPGSHSIRVIVDPQNTVYEGVPGSAQEMNNDGAFSLVVSPLLPDLEPVVNAATGFAGNPVDLTATITNNGGANATGVVVDFFIDTETNKIGSVSVPDMILYGGSYDAILSWTPPGTGIYTVIAIADPGNTIIEYDEDNNKDSNTLTVTPAANPTVYSEDLRASDPFPVVGDQVFFSALVRNVGQADVLTNFDVAFSLDDIVMETVTVNAPLAVGDVRLVTTTSSYVLGGCGYHTLKVVVDSTNTIAEGSAYELDNTATRILQAFRDTPAPLTYGGNYQLTYLPVAQNIIISGNMEIVNGSIVVTEPQEACGRVFIKVTGTLKLVNSTIMARNMDNWPVVIYVGGNGILETWDDSRLYLNTNQDDGTLEVGGNGILRLTDTAVKANVNVHGTTAFFNRVEFQGKKLLANTNGITKIWDPEFQGVTTLALRSEDASAATVDIDLRNATLDATLTSQLIFGGHQYVHLTDVTTTKMNRWWEGTITQKAKVTRFWWLKLEAIDGTGAVLRPEANTNLSIYRLNTVTLLEENAPVPVPGDNIFGTTTNGVWPVEAPNGMVLYKAPSEDRFAMVQMQYMNATYTATGNATINGTRYTPDQDVTMLLDSDLTFRLTFTRLTPDLSVSSISYSGENGGVNLQPINRPMTITAVIANSGEIDVPSVWVNFYFTDVDTNGDGLMDLSNSSYSASFIGRRMLSVPLSGTAATSIYWDRPEGSFETTYVISVVVDPPVVIPTDGGQIRETNEFNNIRKGQLSLYTWPDLHIEASQVHMPTAIQGNQLTITVDVRNLGTNDATNVWVELRVDGSQTPIDVSDQFSVGRGGIATTTVVWTPQTTGPHDLLFWVNITGTLRNKDYNTVDNAFTMQVSVASPPDLAVLRSDFDMEYNMTQRGRLTISVTVYNYGDTDAESFSLGIYVMMPGIWPPASADLVGSLANLNVTALTDETYDVEIHSIAAIEPAGVYNLTVWADSGMELGEVTEANNAVNITLRIILPIGIFSLGENPGNKIFRPRDSFTLVAMTQVKPGEPNAGDPIPNVAVRITVTKEGAIQPVIDLPTTTSVEGIFAVQIFIPDGAEDGTYNLEISSQQGIESSFLSFTVESEKPITFLGLPWWLFLLIIIVIVVVIVAIIVYTKKVGLGKMVECGECGAFIPEDSIKCPKCGVEFEKDMAKCSNCQAWIPLDVKQCPECNVEFATGEVEMADYEEKMRTQYDQVKKKFRQEAETDIGRPLSDDEFEAWWKRQPTFLTFEDWLRDEEEMRKMGSKPCPSCGTLNSINATVCHKCGTLLKKEEPKRGARPPPREAARAPAAAEVTRREETPAAEPRPVEPVPKKVVVKKPVVPPVVQKKVVVKKPVEEGKEESTEGEDTSSEEEI